MLLAPPITPANASAVVRKILLCTSSKDLLKRELRQWMNTGAISALKHERAFDQSRRAARNLDICIKISLPNESENTNCPPSCETVRPLATIALRYSTAVAKVYASSSTAFAPASPHKCPCTPIVRISNRLSDAQAAACDISLRLSFIPRNGSPINDSPSGSARTAPRQRAPSSATSSIPNSGSALGPAQVNNGAA